MFKRVVLFSCAAFLLLGGVASAQTRSAKKLFSNGKKFLGNNDNHRAFLVFRQLAREYPSSEYSDDAHFFIAQYYLQTNNYFQAESELIFLVKNYPDSPYIKDAKTYFSRMKARSLEDKVIDVMGKGDYKTAKIFLEEILTIDPSNKIAKSKLAEVNRILVKMDFQKLQLERERERLEEQSKSIEEAREDIRKLREDAGKMMEEAENMTAEKVSEYEKVLSESREKEEELERRIAKLEEELIKWRGRARKQEAEALTSESTNSFSDRLGSGDLRIIFEGNTADTMPPTGEKMADSILKEKSPSVILISEKENQITRMMKAELVLSLDLQEEWPEKHYLKFRIDYQTISAEDSAKYKPTVIYYTINDMDEVDSENSAYRKKIIVAIDRNRVKEYSVSAFYIQRN